MAARITKLPIQRLPAQPNSTSSNPEQRFWHSFGSPLLINDYSAITSIHFSPLSPHDFAITSSTRVQIFSSKTRKPTKTISRFKDIAYCGTIRKDGKVMVAGDETGLIQVFDLNSRAILRNWGGPENAGNVRVRGHKQAVHVTKWSPASNTTVLSASDDMSVRLWDLPTGEITSTFLGHGDYVRNAAFLPGGGGPAGDMVVSGGYDGLVKLWDPRVPSSSTSSEDRDSAVMTLTHPSAIDALLPMPGSTTILAASGPIIHVWDIIAAKPLLQLTNHQKTVTTLALTSSQSSPSSSTPDAPKEPYHQRSTGTGRVISGSLDGHVKIYNTTSWSVVHGIKYPSPILSLSVSPNSKHLVVGMDGGLLSIRTRTTGKDRQQELANEKILNSILNNAPEKVNRKHLAKTYKGTSEAPTFSNTIILPEPLSSTKTKLPKWETLLRAARYPSALTHVLTTPHTPPLTIYTVLLTLRHLSALPTALANRDPETLSLLLKWLIKHIKRPQFVEVVVDVSLCVLEMYAHVLGQNVLVDGLVGRLRARVKVEVECCEMAQRVSGMVGMLVGGGSGGGEDARRGGGEDGGV